MRLSFRKKIIHIEPENLFKRKDEKIHPIKFIDHTNEINAKRALIKGPPITANKRLAYSPEARNILKRCTGLLRDIHELAKNPNKINHKYMVQTNLEISFHMKLRNQNTYLYLHLKELKKIVMQQIHFLKLQ